MSKTHVVCLAFGLCAATTFGAPAKRRMPALPDAVYKKVVAEETNLNNILKSCRKAANPKSCRSEAITAYSNKLTGILSGVQLSTQMGGRAHVDCLGDTRSSVESQCPAGTHVDKVDVPCSLCCDAHRMQQAYSGSCYLYGCFQ